MTLLDRIKTLARLRDLGKARGLVDGLLPQRWRDTTEAMVRGGADRAKAERAAFTEINNDCGRLVQQARKARR